MNKANDAKIGVLLLKQKFIPSAVESEGLYKLLGNVDIPAFGTTQLSVHILFWRF
jgi:hypothetical protein